MHASLLDRQLEHGCWRSHFSFFFRHVWHETGSCLGACFFVPSDESAELGAFLLVDMMGDVLGDIDVADVCILSSEVRGCW